MKYFWVGLIGVCFFSAAASSQPVKPAGTGLGSPQFKASPDKPVGWRGDGSGRFPGALPPTIWDRKQAGAGYTTKGIVWMTPMPNNGVSSPIVVGDKIFLTGEVADLICLEKQTGRILWIRSNSEFEGLSDAEKKETPAVAEKLAPLAEQLAQANAAVVEALNAQLANAPGEAVHPPLPAMVRKRDIEKQINDQQLAIDKKKFTRYWGQAVFGFAGPTAISDGKNVCAFFTTGVTACYDLEGKRKWIDRGKGGGSEHGNFASPILSNGKVVVWANEMRGYDIATGKLAWTTPAKSNNSYGSMFLFKSGGEPVAGFQSGFFTRIKDGTAIWDKEIFGDTVMTPITDADTIYARVGYPKNNNEKTGFRAFKIPASTEAGKLTPAYEFKTDWADNELTVDDKKNPFDRGFVSSALLVDGLIYQLTQGGGLMVHEAATGEMVYRKVLPLKPRTHYWDWAGCSASPASAGKYIYLMDNQGTTLVIQPGKQYKLVATNVIEESRDGKEQTQNNASPYFEGARMYYRTPGYAYCIGEK